MALLFNVAVYLLYENNYSWASLATEHLTRKEAASQYLMGYMLEKSLSVDRIFVIAIIFSYFRVPPELQHRVLFRGILGAVVLRGVMIALVFVLAYVGVKMILSNHYHIPDGASMGIIGGILLVGVLASIKVAANDPVPLKSPLDQEH